MTTADQDEALRTRLAAAAVKYQLTDRQIEVLAHTATGRSHKEIADLLALNAKTIDHHLHAVRVKTETRSTAHAITTILLG